MLTELVMHTVIPVMVSTMPATASFPPISSPRTFPTISVKTMARELQMGTANVRSVDAKVK